MPLAHQPEPDSDDRHPLGKPINRTETSEWTEIAGRPNWWKDRKGNEKYIEPPEPELVFPFLFYADPDFPPHLWSGM